MKAGIIATAVIVVLLGALWFFTGGKEHLSQAVQSVQQTAPQQQQPADPYSNFNAPSK